MESWIVWVVMGLLVILIVAWIAINNKKQKQIKLKNKQAELALSETLNQTKRHIVYAKTLRWSFIISFGVILCCVLTLLTLMFAPIFQIKEELTEDIILAKNFSILDNYAALKEADEANKNIMQIQYCAFAGLGLLLLIAIIDVISYVKPLAHVERYAFDTFKTIKLNEPWNVVRGNDLTVIEIMGLTAIAQIVAICEFQSVHGVSGYLAFPIIFFVIAVGLWIVNSCLKKSVAQRIKGENLPVAAEQKNESGES